MATSSDKIPTNAERLRKPVGQIVHVKDADLPSLDFDGTVQSALANISMGRTAEGYLLLKKACDMQPDHTNDRVYFVLARIEGDQKMQQKYLERYVELKPTDPYAWLMMGNALDSKGEHQAALAAYRKGIDADPKEYRNVVSSCRILEKLDREIEALQLADEAVRAGALHDRWQRPSHMIYGLSANAWRDDVRNWRAARVLESNIEIIRKEALALLQGGKFWLEGVADTENLAQSGNWTELNLIFKGVVQGRNAKCAPRTVELIEREIPEAASMVRGATKLSVLTPGTRIRHHNGPSNTRMRMHLGIKIPSGAFLRAGDPALPDSTRQWEEGSCLCFDDSFRHEAWHDGDEPRVVLIMDVWHPDMDHKARLDACENQTDQQVYLARWDLCRRPGACGWD